jgi:hypothetical protein
MEPTMLRLPILVATEGQDDWQWFAMKMHGETILSALI